MPNSHNFTMNRATMLKFGKRFDLANASVSGVRQGVVAPH